MMQRFVTLMAALLCCTSLYSIEWHNPQDQSPNPMQGQYWQEEERENHFDKLPLRAKKGLSKEEWHSANISEGMSVRFRTSSQNITIKYETDTQINMSTPKLYGTDNNGGVKEFEGHANSKGEEYTFSNIELDRSVHRSRGYDYQLWLPSLGSVTKLEIGVDDGSFFKFKDRREEFPLVILGKGGGMTLSLQMDRPIIALGGITKHIAEFAAEIEAKAFVVNCDAEERAKGGKQDVVKSVKALREVQPQTPIVISRKEGFEELTASYEGVYLVENISDVESKLREVLSCPKGAISTTQPVTQCRAGVIEWHDQCGYIIKELRNSEAKSVVLGNSIVQNWSSNSPYEERYGGGKAGRAGLECWNKYMDGFINMGIGSDRVENLLWRVYNDQFEIKELERIIIMIGTNNLRLRNTYDEIAQGIDNLIEQIQHRQPQADITIVGVLPRKDIEWAQIQTLNTKIEGVAKVRGVKYKNVGHVLLDENETPRDELYSDGVHLSAEGYMLYGEALMGE
ncbi:MAG: SGNH/GDSL hydrolase N-terminal domain-containing protein [Rikenellaceae bacterium]